MEQFERSEQSVKFCNLLKIFVFDVCILSLSALETAVVARHSEGAGAAAATVDR